MSELAVVAKVSTGQIYRHFKRKGDIILAIVDENIEGRIQAIISIRDQVKNAKMTIEEGMSILCKRALGEVEDVLTFEIMAEAYRNLEVRTAIATMCLRYRCVMRDFAHLANPLLTEDRLDAAEDLLLACMFGIGHREVSGSKLTEKSTDSETARMLLAALRDTA